MRNKQSQKLQKQPNFVNNSQYLINLSPSNTLNIFNTDVYCIGQRASNLICLNETCQSKSTLLCGDIECKCQIDHQQCMKGNLSFIKKKIKTKIMQPQSIKLKVQNIFDTIIDRISDFRDKILSEIDEKLKYANLDKLQKDFLSFLSTNIIPQNLIGKTNILWNIITQKSPKKQNCFQLLIKKVQNLQSLLQQKISQIQSLMQFEQRKLKSQTKLLFLGSQLINSVQLDQNLCGFFPKKLYSTSLLYRASENNFSLKQFFSICGQITDILIICQTNMGKIIGGFTPLSFGFKNGSDNYEEDPSEGTFIFSLTHNDKFKMRNKNNAIYRVRNQQRICFGGCEFEICDRANEVKKCRSYSINYYFQNSNYKSNNMQSFQRFNGNDDEYFTLKQWQAWKIEFLNV